MDTSGTIGQNFTRFCGRARQVPSRAEPDSSRHIRPRKDYNSFPSCFFRRSHGVFKRKYIALILHILSHGLCRQHSYAQAVQQLGMLQMMPVTMVSLSRSGQSTVKSCKLWSRRLQISSGARPSKKLPSKFKATKKKEHSYVIRTHVGRMLRARCPPDLPRLLSPPRLLGTVPIN